MHPITSSGIFSNWFCTWISFSSSHPLRTLSLHSGCANCHVLYKDLCACSPFYKAECVLGLWALKREEISADEMKPRLMWTLELARHKAIALVFMKCAIMRLWRHILIKSMKQTAVVVCSSLCLLCTGKGWWGECCSGFVKLSYHLNVEYKFK